MGFLGKFKDFLLSVPAQASKATIKNYTADVSQFVSWFEGKYKEDFDPNSVNSVTLDTFKKEFEANLSASSVQRHLSSLRKFFHFLKIEGLASHDPFEQMKTVSAEALAKEDPWRLRDFKNNLYVFNASRLTIKNYIIDVKQFLNWVTANTTAAEEYLDYGDDPFRGLTPNDSLFEHIDSRLIEGYKRALLQEGKFSPASVNRKLSSLRKYLAWAQSEGLIPSEISNIQEPKVKPFSNLPAGRQGLAIEQSNNLASQGQALRSYSGFPPLRLAQKLSRAAISSFDTALVSPFVLIFDKVEHIVWTLRGKPVFLSFGRPKPKSLGISKIKNIPKEVYLSSFISTKHLPIHRKLWFHARFTRPNWYKRYHSYPITSYIHFAILVIFMAALGYVFYDALIGSAKDQKQTFAAPVAPPRILSFQGRLTDAVDNPITAATWLRFQIYNHLTSSGSAMLWEEVQKVTPDSDGIFSSLLGNTGSACGAGPQTGACAIPSTLFSENASLYLGVTVEATAELTPRQRLATVSYATNAEFLQGLPPITADPTVTTNVVLALNSSGNLSIGGSATPVFESTGGSFTVRGTSLLLSTTSGGNVSIAPEGLGKIDLQKPIQNSTNNNNISTAVGAVEVNDLFAVLATSSGQSAFTLNQTSTGPLISASASGIAKFTVDNSGNITLAGTTITGTSLTAITGGATAIDFTEFDVSASTGSITIDDGGNAGQISIEGSVLDIDSLTFVGTGSIFSTGDATIDSTTDINLDADGGDILFKDGGTEFARFTNSATDLTITTAGGNILSASALNFGGAAAAAYNYFASDITGVSTPDGVADLYVQDELEVDGTVRFNNITYTFPTTETANYVLQTNGTGTLSWVDTAVSGGYFTTSNGVGYPRGPYTAVNDLLLGSTATASAKFAFLNVGSGTPTASISAGSAGAIYISADGKINTTAKQSIVLGDNATSGNVGIGTTSPTHKLQVSGVDGVLDLESSSANSWMDFSPDGGTRAWAIGHDAGLVTNGFFIYDSPAGKTPFKIYPSSVDNTLVLNAGNVGIGTTAPDAALEINHATGDSLRLTYNDADGSAANYTDFSLSSTGDLTIDPSGGQLLLADTDTFNIGGVTALAYNALSNSGGAAGGAAVTSDNDLYIQGDLEVDGTMYFDGSIDTTFTAGSVVFAGTDGVLAQDNTNFFFDDTNNRLGIGINSSLLGTLDLRATSGTLPVATVSGATSFAGLVVDNSGVGDIFTASSSGLNRFVITQAGNVGIGTTGPLNALHVNAVGRFGDTTNTSNPTTTISPGIRIGLIGADEDAGLEFYSATAGSGFGWLINAPDRLSNNVPLSFLSRNNAGTWTERVTMRSDTGNVGIGTTVPDARLEINHATGDSLRLTYNDADGSAANYTDFSLSSTGDLTIDSSGGNILLSDALNAGGAAAASYNYFASDISGNSTPDGVADLYIQDELEVDGTVRFNNITYTFPSAETSNYILQTNGTGTLAWVDPAVSGGYFTTSNGVGYPRGPYTAVNDLLIGGTSSTSAKFAVLNVNSGTPTASLSAGAAGGLYLTAAGAIDTTAEQTLSLGTNSTTGNIEIGNGGGTFYIETDIKNDTTSNTGFVKISDKLWITGTEGAGNPLAIFDNLGAGDILTASASGTPRFSVTSAGGIKLGTAEGSANNCLLSGGAGAASSWGSCGAGTSTWTQDATNLVLYPAGPYTAVTDVLIGSTATSSAKFGFLNVNSGTPTASISANSGNNATTLTGTGVLGTTNMQTLQLGNSTTGNINFYSGSNTLTSTGALTLALTATATQFIDANNSSYLLDPAATGNSLLVAGKIASGTLTPLATLDIRGVNATLPVASLSGSTNFAALVVDNTIGDIFTASSSGLNRFVVTQAGRVGIGVVPTQALEFNSGMNIQLNSGNLQDYGDVTFKVDADNNGTNVFKFLDGAGNQQVTINESGQMSLGGDTSPGATLDLGASGTIEGAGLTDCDGVTSKLLWDSSTEVFSCGNDRGSTYVRKASDENVTNSAVLQNDDELLFSIGANETWAFQVFFSVDTPLAQDFQAAITAPASATCVYGIEFGQQASATKTQTCGTGLQSLINSTVAEDFGVTFQGTIANGANAGTVNIQWAQVTAGAGITTTVNAGSYIIATKLGAGADIAEIYNSKEALEPGTLVALDPSIKAGVTKANELAENDVIGIVSARPGVVLSDEADYVEGSIPIQVALSGRVPVKVSSVNGPIREGDPLTLSPISGVAMKSTRPGPVIGKAMTSYDNPDPGEIGSVLGFVNLSWYDPDVYLTSTGGFEFAPVIRENPTPNNNPYVLRGTGGEIIERIGAFKEIMVATLKAATIQAKNITSDAADIASAVIGNISSSIIQTTDLIASNIITTDLKTSFISPIDDKLVIRLNSNDPGSSLEIQNSSGSAVARFDAEGNATFSGKLKAQSLESEDASIAGTLRATRIIADQIEGLFPSSPSANYITNNYYSASPSALGVKPLKEASESSYLAFSGPDYDIATFSAQLANINEINGQTATFYQGLMSFGPSSLYDLSVASQLSVGAQLILADRSINVLGGSLMIQPLKQGGVDFLAGAVKIDTDGNLEVNGNANFAKDVSVKGTLSANIISPLPDQDLVIKLASQGQALEPQNLSVKNASNSSVFTINQAGSFIASGSGTFEKINLSLVPKALALSDTEVIATGSAGTLSVSANENEITVLNELVTKESLIYITPVGDSSGQNLYLSRQTEENPKAKGIEGSFTVGISSPIPKDIRFNYLIIN